MISPTFWRFRRAITAILLCGAVQIGCSISRANDEPAAKTTQVEAGDLKLSIPETWKKKEASSRFRVAEIEVPATGEDKQVGELVITYFGKSGAGGAQDNIKRWVGQFEEQARKVKVVTGESPTGKYMLVDLSGTYNKPIGPPMARQSKTMTGWRVLNVALETPNGPYYLKLDGPEKTIAAAENDFRTSFGGKKGSEKEQKQE